MVRQPLWHELLKLSDDERMDLANRLWDTVAVEKVGGDLTDAQKRLLEQRLQEHRDNPDDVVDWPTARARVERGL